MKISGGCYCGSLRYESMETLKPLFNVIVESVSILLVEIQMLL